MRANTEKKLSKVYKLINKGASIKDACVEAGLSMATYYKNTTSQPKSDKSLHKAKSHIKTDSIDKLKAENAALKKFIKKYL